MWSIYFKKYIKTIEKGLIPDIKLTQKLIFSWGNEGYSSQTDYINTMIKFATETNGLILECGSGLSTLLIGVIAKNRKIGMVSFEHIPAWAGKVKKELDKYGLTHNEIYVRPLINYGDFDWYDIDNIDIPEIRLCICDGPPGNTFGGRKGMLFLFKEKVTSGAIILVDDTIRKAEQKMIKQWQKILPIDVVFKGRNDPHAILIIQ